MTLKQCDMELAENVFSRGKMSPSNMFDELTKEYLFLSQEQNEVLTRSLQIERMLMRYKNDRQFSHIFHYIEELARIARHQRIVERPVFLAMSELTRLLNAIRQHGKALGFLYPDMAPTRQLLGPRKFEDKLAYSQLPTLPMPQLGDVFEGARSVSLEDRDAIRINLMKYEEEIKGYRRDQAQKLGSFMDSVAGTATRLDSFLGFHLDLHAHCDGEMRDMMKDKASHLFSPPFRNAVLGRGLSRSEKDKMQSEGILDGESQIRSRLAEATKEDELLKKAINRPSGSKQPKRFFNKYKGSYPIFSFIFTVFFFRIQGEVSI